MEDVVALNAYPWPGNIRELNKVIEGAVILASHNRLHLDLATGSGDGSAASPSSGQDFATIHSEEQRLARMRNDILLALEGAGGRVSGKSGAAALFVIQPSTLRSRMKTLGVERR